MVEKERVFVDIISARSGRFVRAASAGRQFKEGLETEGGAAANKAADNKKADTRRNAGLLPL